ncbi:MAG: [protein-PII] uridylyltransferase [Pirellulaceae bacterium]|nr:[protein-PII] uridylyltransferase [Pirellulaceae bacterium]
MQPGPRLRPAVLAARERLERGRAKLRTLHDSQAPAVQVCNYLADLLDGIVLDLYQAAVAEAGQGELESRICLVPLAGYGRRDLAPFSDLDLMLLYAPGAKDQVAPVARLLTQHLCDAGLTLGNSFRTPAEACRLALQDATIFTSLAEARYLSGSAQLYNQFAHRLRQYARRHRRSLIAAVERERGKERLEYGETVYLLKPNLKRSPGGLRDLQLARWIGFARYGESELELLKRMDVLSPSDLERMRSAHAFLLRLRNELHFAAGKPQDVLGRHEQLRLAERFQYRGSAGVLPVEEFMRDYFEHTSEGRYAVDHFLASVHWRDDPRRIFRPLFAHRVERDFRVGPIHISATRRGLARVCGDLEQVLWLMDLANQYGTRIEHETWQAIRSAMTRCPDLELTPAATQRFLALMSSPGRLADLLRRLHETRVLEQLIPPLKHARCLLQFNEYHKYTVDEHCLRAVQCATDFQQDPRPVGEAYRGIKQKRILHLALLMHDLGKGYPQDHSEVGLRLAAETARHLGLPAHDAETLKFLVHKHLLMTHLAFRQDLNDDSVSLKLAVEVGSQEMLQMLYVLSCADLAAVGPHVLNSWKLELLTELFERARWHLSDDAFGAPSRLRSHQLRQEVLELLRSARDIQDLNWWRQQVNGLPDSYLRQRTAGEIVQDLKRLHDLPADQAVAWGRYLESREVTEYTVVAHEEMTRGIFHRLTGALTRKSHQILSAEIHTLHGNLVLDRFYVEDMHSSGAPLPARLEEVSAALVRALTEPAGEQPSFPSHWRDREARATASLNQLPPRVHFDNNSSDRHTVVTVFAYDFMGLLYTIARALFDAGLSVQGARISTHLDQVVDVFYVVDERGRKLEDPPRQQRLREHLLREIQQRQDSDLQASPG